MIKGKYLTGWMVLALLVIGILVAVPSAQAVTYDFTSNHITAGENGISPFGNVVLTQNGSNVDITVNLFNGNLFVNTGAGAFQNFLWNATGVTTGDLTALNGQDLEFTGSSGSAGLHANGTGDFDFGAVFTDQPTGGVGKLPGPITFEVANASISDLTIANTNGQFFAIDIILGDGQGGYDGNEFVTNPTGVVDASGPTKVPEPTTMLLLGLGLIGMAGVKIMLKN